jgi:CubicO group peptidase (beta-lactamase class C family)
MSPSRRTFVLGAASAMFPATPAEVRAAANASARRELQTSSPDAVGVSAARLEAVLAAGSSSAALRSLLVVRSGMLIGERYYGGASETELQAVNSATKSLCSMLVGTTLGQGKLAGLSQAMGQLLPELAQRFPNALMCNVTLAQVLSGTSGLAYDFRKDLRTLMRASDVGAYVFSLPSDGTPANTWSYNDAAVSLLAPVLEQARGVPLEEVARHDIFGPLGIERWSWGRDRSGQAMAYMGLRLRARDFIKLAWLMASLGTWNGSAVVPSQWVQDSTRTHVTSAWRNPPIQDIGYGYMWFTGALGGRPVAWAWGYGGQFAFLVPSLELAVTTTATDPPLQDLRTQTAAVTALVAQVVDVVAHGQNQSS